MFSSMYRRTVVAVAASSVFALGVSALPASAATQQSGLVNVSLTNINVPIGIAANVCDVQASVLAAGPLTGGPLGSCSAVSRPTVTGGGGGGNTSQTGLVNISASNVNVPIGIAANVCDVQASVLAAGPLTGGPLGSCSAVSTPTA